MSFVAMGGKFLGIQIATSGKARLLRPLFGAILDLMRLNFLFFVDPAKSCDTFGNDALGGCRITDITRYRQDVRVRSACRSTSDILHRPMRAMALS
jgi:hypothetical protein